MSVVAAAKRAGVTKAAWTAAERREALGTISLDSLGKFLSALGCAYSYVPRTELPLEKMLERQAVKFAENEMRAVNSTMALEDQLPGAEFSNAVIKRRGEDIVRSGNWKEIWQ